jgi:hypothetical protein
MNAPVRPVFNPEPHVRVAMDTTEPGRAVLLRHRVDPKLQPDEIAHLCYAGAVVSSFDWDEVQRNSLGMWAAPAEHWARAQIAASWATS